MKKIITHRAALVRRWPLLAIAVALAYPAGAWGDDVGGGYTAAGLHGDYFANTTWTGAPAFSRQDDRVEFPDVAPGNHLSPGGLASTGFDAVGAANWSARWTGQVIPRFSETYTFKILARGSCQLKINGKAIIDQAQFSGAPTTGSCDMTAGAKYDIEIDYSHAAGDWAMSVHWSSPSTPEEVIDPLGVAGVHVFYNGDSEHQAWANVISAADNCIGPKSEVIPKDANGWPKADCRFQVLDAGEAPLGDGTFRNMGTYLLTFTGRADVSSFMGGFSHDRKYYGNNLPSGVGWDAKTNITTVKIYYGGIGHLEWLTFRNTRRDPADTTATGVTNVKLMAPTEFNGTTPYDPGIYFQPLYKKNLSRYTVLRRPHNEYYEPDYTKYKWSDRNPGQYPIQNDHTSYEWQILLCNETGKDCYVQLPVEVGDDYVKKCALIFRYGSDGLNPYDPAHEKDSQGIDLYNPIPESGPKFPPLNANLRVYIESGNEVWDAYGGDGPGYAGAATYCRKACKNAVPGEDHSAEFAIINFDKRAGMRRFTLLRTKEISDIFRTVFPDDMPNGTAQIRPIWEWQYEWTATFEDMLAFFDHYFNNGDGIKHVATPHPISYFLWGGGGAVYFSPAHEDGAQKDVAFANPGFEENAIAPGTTSATIAGWATTGNAGIYRRNDHQPVMVASTLGKPHAQTSAKDEAFGYKFTVGDSDLVVYEMGRWVSDGNIIPHLVEIINADTGIMLGFTTIATKGVKPGAMAYSGLGTPIPLKAKTSYMILSSESIESYKFDAFYDQDTTISVKDDITVDGPASAVRTARWWAWAPTAGTPGKHSYGPVDFKFVKGPVAKLGYVLDPSEGSQAAFIGDTGSISQSVNFTKPGSYALKFMGAAKENLCNRIKMSVTDPSGQTSNITPLGQSDGRIADLPYMISQGWTLDYRRYCWNSSTVFKVTQPGAYTLKITGTDPKKYVFLDKMEIVSVDAMFVGGLGGGDASGQPPAVNGYNELLKIEADWVRAYGLKEAAYEGGWTAGGDFAQLAFHNWVKYNEPRTRLAQIDSINLFVQAGSSLYICGSYPHWPQGFDSYWADASKYPLPQAIDYINDRLRPEPTNGVTLPTVLTTRNLTLVENATPAGVIHDTGGWIVWNVITSKTANYTLVAKTTGGSATLLIDDATPVTSGDSVKLTAGLHTVKIKSTANAVNVTEVDVTQKM